MNCRIPLVVGAVAGGAATAALLAAGAASAAGGADAGATADSSSETSGSAASFPDVPGTDAFTIGNDTFDPFTVNDGTEVEGFTPVSPLFGAAPLTDIGGGNVSLLGTSLPLATQAFDVYSTGSTASLLGIADTNEDAADIFGMTNTEFTISQVAAADGVKDSALPTDGTVYDVFNLGNGFENVYVDVPGTDGGTVTDTLETPFGNVDLSSLFGGFDATEPINPGDAFIGLPDASSVADAGAPAADTSDVAGAF